MFFIFLNGTGVSGLAGWAGCGRQTRLGGTVAGASARPIAGIGHPAAEHRKTQPEQNLVHFLLMRSAR